MTWDSVSSTKTFAIFRIRSEINIANDLKKSWDVPPSSIFLIRLKWFFQYEIVSLDRFSKKNSCAQKMFVSTFPKH